MTWNEAFPFQVRDQLHFALVPVQSVPRARWKGIDLAGAGHAAGPALHVLVLRRQPGPTLLLYPPTLSIPLLPYPPTMPSTGGAYYPTLRRCTGAAYLSVLRQYERGGILLQQHLYRRGCMVLTLCSTGGAVRSYAAQY